jgi:hypothetical protein
MQAPPRFWRCFTGYFGLDEAASRRWWEAVCVAQGAVPVAWHRAMLACADLESLSPEGVRTFLLMQVPLGQIIELIEALAALVKVSRRRASALEDHVLAKVQANGAWK